jgi:hypothetical protein
MSYTAQQIAAARKALRTETTSSSTTADWLVKKEMELRKAQQDHQAKRLLMFVDLYMEGYNIPDAWKERVDAHLASMQQPSK